MCHWTIGKYLNWLRRRGLLSSVQGCEDVQDRIDQILEEGVPARSQTLFNDYGVNRDDLQRR